MLSIFKENIPLVLLAGLADVMLGIILGRKIGISTSRQVAEALGPRNDSFSLCMGFLTLMKQGTSICEKRIEKIGIYKKAREKMRKAGYRGEHSAFVYLAVRYLLSSVAFLTAFLVNYPDLIKPVALVVLINATMELVISVNRRRKNLKFQKYIYKIYKYLHNQVSSGVKPTDAVRSVYEVADDRELKRILIRLAARYELTLDIDTALDEFRSNFDAHEAETLCIAIKQGIETGDNKELLAKQEDIMFKKYFNYVQAETDGCRNRSVAAAAVFVAIIVAMIVIPLLNEVNQAVGRIFIN